MASVSGTRRLPGGAREEEEEEQQQQKEAARPTVRVMARLFKRIGLTGVGAFGEAYKAWDSRCGIVVAVKELSRRGRGRGRGGGGGDGRYGLVHYSGVREVAREVMSLAACRRKPGVAQLRWMPAVYAEHGAGCDSLVVMEYAGGFNLRELMRRRRELGKPFSEAEVRRIMRRLLVGVNAVIEAGILHRDIQPENVVVDDGTEDITQKPTATASTAQSITNKKKNGRKTEMRYTICDLGMAVPAMDKPDYSPGGVLTSIYNAPELLLGSRQYDSRVDTWGLGCIMAELLDGPGDPLFNGDTNLGIMGSVLEVISAAGVKLWPGFKRLAADPVALVRGYRNSSRLREKFPGAKEARRTKRPPLSSAGFDVLSGLLEGNPEKGLTAVAALHMPWFLEESGIRRVLGGCAGISI